MTKPGRPRSAKHVIENSQSWNFIPIHPGFIPVGMPLVTQELRDPLHWDICVGE
jgi:hypothetical protein